MTGAETVQAAFGSELIATGSNTFSLVYLPEGKHEISATVGGKPKTLVVTVDNRVLASFQADLQKRLADNVRPFAGFDHQSGPASMLPMSFRYENGVGLILEGELTAAGQTAIDGRNYSYWSPTFMQDKGIPVGLTNTGEIGSFVNDPAFRTIERIAASHTENIMDITNLIELGLVEANQEPESALEVAKAAIATLRESASTAESVSAANATALEEVNAAKADVTRLSGELETVKASLSRHWKTRRPSKSRPRTPNLCRPPSTVELFPRRTPQPSNSGPTRSRPISRRHPPLSQPSPARLLPSRKACKLG